MTLNQAIFELIRLRESYDVSGDTEILDTCGCSICDFQVIEMADDSGIVIQVGS